MIGFAALTLAALDGLDLKRMMIVVVIALMPTVLMAMYNTGLQAHRAIAAGAAQHGATRQHNGPRQVVDAGRKGEHAAAGVTVGMSMVGLRAANFSSGQGIAYMHESLYAAAGKRLTYVLNMAARAMMSFPVAVEELSEPTPRIRRIDLLMPTNTRATGSSTLPSHQMVGATNRPNCSGRREASVFGVISPNSNSSGTISRPAPNPVIPRITEAAATIRLERMITCSVVISGLPFTHWHFEKVD